MSRTRPYLPSMTTDRDGNRVEDTYLPLDAKERAREFIRWSGTADGWPVRLTRCGEPAESIDAEFRRLLEAR